MTVQLARAIHFDCAHSYEVKSWTKDKNLSEFGACFSPIGHGHTYRLEAYFQGAIDDESGMIINLRDLDLALKSCVSPIEGRFLNKEVDEFKEQIPTTEKIGLYLFDRLKEALQPYPGDLVKIRLFETDDLWIEIAK